METPLLWHVIGANRTISVVSDGQLRRMLADGTVGPETLVWCAGMRDWQPCGQVPGLVVSARAAATRHGYLLRHWRGELSLATAYWLNGILATILAVAAQMALNQLDITRAPRLISAGLAAFEVFLVILSVWQAVGVWRSAQNSIQRRKAARKWAIWAHIALVVTALGCVSLLGALANAVPYTIANLQIAFFGETIPEHSLYVLNRGTELKISGGIGFGIADEVKRRLSAVPTIRTVTLDSGGGRVAEAEKIRELVRDRHLATYTNTLCASACTLIYIGGFPRYLGPDGRLGFHRFAFPGLTPAQDGAVNRQGERFFVESGISVEFARKVFSTSSADLWFPDRAALAAAHVITQEVDGLAFAPGPIARAAASGLLEAIPSFAALRAILPDAYREAVDRLVAASQNGQPLGEVLTAARAPLIAALTHLRLDAPDDIQVQIAAVLSEEGRLLADKSPRACWAVLTGQGAGSAYALLPPAMNQREGELAARIIRASAVAHPAPVLSGDQASREMQDIWRRVGSRGIDISGLQKSPESDGQARTNCRAIAAFLAEVAAMPPQRAGPLMRYLLRQ